MKKGFVIYLVVLLLLVTGIDYLLLSTRYLEPAKTQNFSSGPEHSILIKSDSDTVNVITASNGYYRIKSEDVVIEGEHITGDMFQNNSTLPVGRWVQEDGENVSYTVTSATPTTVTLTSTVVNNIYVVIVTLLVTVMFYFLGYILFIM